MEHCIKNGQHKKDSKQKYKPWFLDTRRASPLDASTLLVGEPSLISSLISLYSCLVVVTSGGTACSMLIFLSNKACSPLESGDKACSLVEDWSWVIGDDFLDP